LETFVDRANASHAPRCDGQLAGEGSGASKCDEQRRYQASPKSRTDSVDLSHANSPRPVEESPFTSTMRLPEHPHHPSRTWGWCWAAGWSPLVDRLPQLSICCSSIDLLSSRCVSAVGAECRCHRVQRANQKLALRIKHFRRLAIDRRIRTCATTRC
jgi:hypothetical protein